MANLERPNFKSKALPEADSAKVPAQPAMGEKIDAVLVGDVAREPSINGVIVQYESDRKAAGQKDQAYRVERGPDAGAPITVYKKDESGVEVPHRLTIEVLDSPEHPTLPKVYALLQKMFDPEELDSLEMVKGQMQGLRYGHEMGAQVFLFAIKDEEGNVITTLDGGLLPLMDKEGKPTGESVFGVFYVATDDNWKQYGLGREVMLDAYRFMEEQARKAGTTFIGGVGECTWTSQRYWEKLGWRRPYSDDGKGNIKEICYTQPPLGFDLENGEVEEGSGEAPEHLMVHLFDKSMLNRNPDETARRLASICNVIYRTSNYINPKAFDEAHPDDPQGARAAYEQHLTAIKPLEDSFGTQFKGQPIKFYSEEELMELEKQGRTVVENWGSEEEKEAVKSRHEAREAF